MRYFIAALVAALMCATHAQAQGAPPPGAHHPISNAEIRAMAYGGCVEAGYDPDIWDEKYVQFSIYDRGLKDRRDLGGWNLWRVTHHPGQYNGVEWHKPCGPKEMRRSLAIAYEIAEGRFVPEPGWEHISNFLAPCYSTPGGRAGFRGLVYVGTHGGHDFYRERRPGERPDFRSCVQSKTRFWHPHRHHRPRQPPAYLAER